MSSIERNAIQKMKLLDDTPLILRLSRSDMRPDPGQPRKKRDPEKLKGLAQTMKKKQLQPVLVREADGETPYMIVIGEGRWLAAGINEEELGEEQYLDAILVDETNIAEIRAMQLIENLQREDMSEIDTAAGWRELIELGAAKTAKDVAQMVGVSEGTVSVYLKVLEGPEQVRKLVEQRITKMDTARTLLMLAEINKDRADALVQGAIEGGKLKRDDVRAAYAEEKARAENAAAAAEALTEAAQNAQDNTPIEPETHVSEDSGQPGAQPDGEPEAHAAPQQLEAAPAPKAPEAHQKPAGAAPHAPTTGDKGEAEKTAETAANRVSPAGSAGPAPAPAPQPTPAPAAAAVPQLDAGADATEQTPESPMVVAEKFDVLVSIRSGSVDEERFIGLDVEYGNARLASHIVHRDSTRAWVQFGTAEREYTSAFKCGDLEIVKIVPRG